MYMCIYIYIYIYIYTNMHMYMLMYTYVYVWGGQRGPARVDLGLLVGLRDLELVPLGGEQFTVIVLNVSVIAIVIIIIIIYHHYYQ